MEVLKNYLGDDEKGMSYTCIIVNDNSNVNSNNNSNNNNNNNCVNNKMLEHDWLLTALIYALIGCFISKLSDLTCPITNKFCNRTAQIGQLSSQ